MNLPHLFTDLAIVILFLAGVAQFRNVRDARRGNLTAAFALVFSVVFVLYRSRILDPAYAVIALLTGSALGWWVAGRTSMVQIPAMVAFQHGAGSVAAFLVAYQELTRGDGSGSAMGTISAYLGLIIGAATFSGSIVASAKLANRIRQAPVTLPAHNTVLLRLIVLLGIFCVAAAAAPNQAAVLLVVVILVSSLLGAVFAVRIGGADMPVLISFLNATAGLAAAFCGVSIENRLLAACGATVAASGSILTHQMCLAMNRPLARVFLPLVPTPSVNEKASAERSLDLPQRDTRPVDPVLAALEAAKRAATVMIIPGYGMAQAQAQFETVSLARRMDEMGKRVAFAIHPIAGRMPGHMHVLLAEAEADPDMLADIREANPEFSNTDLAVIVGACDVVNPAAVTSIGTPISGMPILKAHEARQVVVCNLDERPGYSGVDNPLYKAPNAILLFGDARASIERLLEGLSNESQTADGNYFGAAVCVAAPPRVDETEKVV
jgi:NAD(P) transhydrogenase subunit beta